jgi:DNA-3-methyladenine glycosylase I
MRSEASPDKRCSWVNVDDPLLLEYHAREWGIPVHSDPKHFEVLVLSGAQAGLNWSLVLKKREGYRLAFDKFDPEKVARYSEKQIRTLLADAEIIRNRMKIEAAVRDARAFFKIQEEFGGFDPTAGGSSAGSPNSAAGKLRDRFQRLPPNPRHSARISSSGDSASSGQPSRMRTCRRLDW